MNIHYSEKMTMLTLGSVVINFLFAHQVDLLSDEKKAAISRQNSKELLMGVNMNKHFPWIAGFLESLPESISRPIMPPGLIDMLALFDVSFLPKFRYSMTM
jgi:hypothetical protein